MNQDMEEKVAGSQGMDKKMFVMLSLLIYRCKDTFLYKSLFLFYIIVQWLL